MATKVGGFCELIEEAREGSVPSLTSTSSFNAPSIQKRSSNDLTPVFLSVTFNGDKIC